jgi:hypothetical protein
MSNDERGERRHKYFEEYGDRVDRHRARESEHWAAAGSKDTELGVKMEPEVGHGATEIYP